MTVENTARVEGFVPNLASDAGHSPPRPAKDDASKGIVEIVVVEAQRDMIHHLIRRAILDLDCLTIHREFEFHSSQVWEAIEAGLSSCCCEQIAYLSGCRLQFFVVRNRS